MAKSEECATDQSTRDQRLAAFERMRAARQGRTLGMPVKDAVAEGRR